MITRIVDASVAIKWFVSAEPKRESALKILHEIERSPRAFAVPELFFNEMLAVFSRLAVPEDEMIRYLDSLQDLGLFHVGNGSELLRLAARVACQYRITGYDAIYAASAKLLSGVWITADEKAHKRLASLNISMLLG